MVPASNVAGEPRPIAFFWQGIDPVESARVLGDAGAIFHVHGKDTRIDPHNTRLNGTLDAKSYGDLHNRSWVFAACGYGHGDEFWKPFIAMLRLKGYDGVISIEHEDAYMSVQEGFEKAVAYDPSPPQLVGIEEPENQLHPRLLSELAEECRAASERTQLMITTHSPFFVNGLEPRETWIRRETCSTACLASWHSTLNYARKRGFALHFTDTLHYNSSSRAAAEPLSARILPAGDRMAKHVKTANPEAPVHEAPSIGGRPSAIATSSPSSPSSNSAIVSINEASS